MTETLKQIFHRMSIVFSNQLAILITIPYITFTLGIEEYGIVAAGIILVQICWVLCDWGFGYHSIEFFSKNKSTKLRNQYFSSVFIIKIIIICFFSLFVYLLAQSKLILVTNQYLLLSLFLPFLTGGLNPLNFLQAIKKPKYLVKPTFFSRILYLILIFSLVKNFESSYWVFVAQGITMFFISFYGYLVLFKMYNFKLVLPNVFFLKKQFFEATPFFLNGIITINFSSFWGFGLSLLAGPFQIAIYSLADLVLRSANTLSTVVPHTIRANYIDEPLQKIKRIIFSFTLFYLVLMIIGILVIPIFIKIFFDSSFYASIYVIQIMLIVWFIGSINKLLGFPVFSKIYDSKRLNQLVYLFGMLHLSAFGIWASFSSYQADQLVLYLLFISVLECIIFALFILMKYLKKPNSKAIK
ncbi:oligosaccharide flippase family protein [Methylophilaceae bacterium]|nr:oligosaccharide flippase family protein [Methylophilaceae bacterium]